MFLRHFLFILNGRLRIRSYEGDGKMNLRTLKVLRFFHLINKKNYNEKRQIEIVKSSPMFDAKWYLEQNQDVKAKKIGAAKHYVKWGWKEGRDPSKEFSTKAYLEQYPELLEKNWCPVFHYMLEHKELMQQALKKIKRRKKSGKFLKIKNKKVRDEKNVKKKEINIVKSSSYFDGKWYLDMYPEVAKLDICPAEHYYKYGWKEGKNPSLKFSTKDFLLKYPECEICPLVFDYNRNAYADLSIVSIMRNEAPYVKEWLDYHRLVGVKRFYIYDNESTDNLKVVLKPYVEQGIVVYKYFPGLKKDGVQGNSYKDCIDLYKSYTKWLAIVDADEFIIPVKKKTIPEFLKDYERYPGVVVNWVMYDSNSHVEKPQGGVLKNYTRIRYDCNCNDNIVVKSIVNPRKVAYPEGHCCTYKNQELSVTERFIRHQHSDVTLYSSIKKIRINHYWSKSYSEYLKKIQKPRYNGQPWKSKPEDYNFTDYKYDYIMWKYVVKLKKGGFFKEFIKYLILRYKNSIIVLRHFFKYRSFFSKNITKYVDEKWYLKHYPDYKKEADTAFDHYMTIGWKKGYNPSAKFDTNFYLNTYPDIAKVNINPLLHYIQHGKKEGRIISSSFVTQNPSVIDKIICKFKKINPKVSIIVASYNCQDYIREALDSLIAQTYKNCEIIIVDDGSTDGTLKIVRQYVKNHKNISLYRHVNAKKLGFPVTLKLGIEKANGEYIAFCESNDCWTPDYLEEKVKVINRYKNTNIIVNDVQCFGRKSEICESYLNKGIRSLAKNVVKVNVLNQTYKIIPTFSAIMFKKSILEKCDFNTPVTAWLDWWICRQILIKNKLFYINKPLTMWRLQDGLNNPDELSCYIKKYDDFIVQSNVLLLERYPNLKHKLLQNNSKIKKIKNSSLFDAVWYCKQYPEVARMKIPAYVHYFYFGWKKGYNPSENFHTKSYLNLYQDIRQAHINPLWHYLTSGKKEGRIVIPCFHRPETYGNIDTGKDKILLVSHILNHTGAPILLLQIAKMFISKGYEVVLLSPQDGDLKQKFLDAGVTVIVDANAYCNEKSCAFYKQFHFKFCICNTCTIALIYSYLNKFIPTIWWIHDNLNAEMIKAIQTYLVQAKDIFVPSELTKSYIKGYNKNIKMLPYPIKDIGNYELKKFIDKRPLKISVYAAFQVRKGQDIFIQAIKKLPENIRNQCIFELIGENGEMNYKEKHLEPLCKGIPEIKFVDLIKDTKQYHNSFSSVDILCCPSREDPYPLVVIDALMHGCPVILSDHVGQKDFIENMKNGAVFESENADMLAQIIEKFVEHKSALSEMSEQARKTFLKHFDYTECEKKIMKIVRSKCGK